MELKQWITERGLTQAEAAKLLKADQSSVSRWTSGERKVPPNKVTHVSKVTGIPPYQLRPDIFERRQ
jgi:transcriptional regulator with XRE-family HTH domain